MAQRDAINTPDAARPAAFYSQAVRAGDCVYTAGCVGIDPATGKTEAGFEAQTRRALENVRATLEAAGSSMDHVVKTTCFVKHQADFVRLDPVYREFFGGPPPARTTIVCDLVRDEFLVEVEAVAVTGETGFPPLAPSS